MVCQTQITVYRNCLLSILLFISPFSKNVDGLEGAQHNTVYLPPDSSQKSSQTYTAGYDNVAYDPNEKLEKKTADSPRMEKGVQRDVHVSEKDDTTTTTVVSQRIVTFTSNTLAQDVIYNSID